MLTHSYSYQEESTHASIAELTNRNREMSSIGMPIPDYGIIDIGERFLYEYVVQDGAPLVLNRIPWTEENAQFATAWREYIDEQIKAYGSTGTVG